MKYLYLLLILTITTSAQAKEAYIENKGQIIDQNRIPNLSVLYLYNGNGLNVQLRKTGFSYDVWKNNADSTTTYNRVDIDFANKSAAMRTTTSGQSADYLNYYTEYTGVNGVTHVRNYSEVVYQNVWNGIDLQFVLNGDEPKYNFIIHAGAKLSDVKLDIKGANNITQKNNGLVLSTNLTDIEEAVPNSFYTINEKKIIAHAGFMQNSDGTYGLKVIENIPVNSELVIDPMPIVQWGTFYGGGNQDDISGTSTNKNGTVYVCGKTLSTNAIASSGAFQSTISVDYDAFFARFTPSGVRSWGTYYGGTDYDDAGGIVSDSIDYYTYLGGTTLSASVFGTTGAHQQNYVGNNDAFLAKFDSTGARIWSTYYGGNGTESGYAVALDSAENIYLCGRTIGSATGIATPNGHDQSNSGTYDGFIVKFSSNGTRLWGTYYGGTNHDYFWTIKAYKNNLYAAGLTGSLNNISTTGAYQTSNAGNFEAFLVKFNLNGARIWGTYFGSTGTEGIKALAVDKDSNVYIAGPVSSSGLPITTGAHQSVYGGGTSDGFIAKFTPGGSLAWSTFYGGSGSDTITAMTMDNNANLYLTGFTTSTNAIATSNGIMPTSPGGIQMMIAKFDSSGKRKWGTYYGNAMAYCMANDRASNVYIGGLSLTASIGTSGSHQPAHNGGGTDGFLLKINVCDSGFAIATSNSPVTLADSIKLYASGGQKYSWVGPNGFSSNLQNPIKTPISFADGGIYTVTVTDTTAGCSETKQINVVVQLGISNITSIGSFSLYPNPTTSITQIDIDLKQEQKLSVNITDITGRIVFSTKQKTYNTGKSKIELDIHSLPAGTYICRLQNEYGNAVWSGKMTTIQ